MNQLSFLNIFDIGGPFVVKRLIFLPLCLFIIFVLASCGLEDIYSNNDEQQTNAVTPLEDLIDTEYFLESALPHILEGELNRKGQAVGFHYAELPTRKGEIIEDSETEEDEHGIYEAKVSVSEVEKTSNNGRSTFFPDSWDSQDVVDAINEAYETKDFISGNTYEGMTEEGIIVRMYLNESDKIISAFPVYEGS